ncbi:MAG: hypothetical protein LQ346_008716, partial [Caloplaca aetnensis]
MSPQAALTSTTPVPTMSPSGWRDYEAEAHHQGVIFAAVGGTFLFLILSIVVVGVSKPIGAAVWRL